MQSECGWKVLEAWPKFCERWSFIRKARALSTWREGVGGRGKVDGSASVK
jgi:hypothetical protein